MIYPVIPADNLEVIQVAGGRCIVARYRQIAPYEYTLEYATNWPALEADARQVVQDFIGAITGSDVFPCPDDLAARAVWDGET